jgi:hypothetical protein
VKNSRTSSTKPNATLFEFAENVATRHTVKEIEKKITKENEEK